MLVTVFTPTYNRASLLPRLFESLEAQSVPDFEWLIVDDGSTDETERVVNAFHSSFPMRYIKKKNGGKHTAINLAVKQAAGELFFIVDSDDSLPTKSIEMICKYWNQVKCDASFAGVSGYMAHYDGRIVAYGGDYTVLDCNALDFRYKYGMSGDMAEVFKTSVLCEYPFPEIEGEHFCPEALVWNRIAQRYRLRYFRKVVYYCDYLAGGLTDRIVNLRMESPVASTTHYCELSQYQIPFQQKVKAAINYWRFYACLQDKKKAPKLHWKWFWTRPLGVLMHQRDKR